MQITETIQIDFQNPTFTDLNLGIELGIGIYSEDDYPTGINYLSTLLVKGFDSGCSREIELKTYPRKQTESGGTIKISNSTQIYQSWIDNDCDPKGKMLKRIFYEPGGIREISAHEIKEVHVSPSLIEFSLGSLDSPMTTEISKPLTGDTYYPVIFGDHEKGIFASGGLVQEGVDTFPWSFILKSSSEVISVVDEGDRTFTYGAIFDGIPQLRAGKPPSYYENADTDRWFTVASGGGSGSYKITSTIDDTDRVKIPFTRMPAYDIDTVAYDIKTLDSEGEMTTDVTVGTIQILSLSYNSDFFAGITSSNLADVINSDGAIVPTNTIDKNGNTISLGDAEISGTSIIGYSFIEMGTPTYAESISETTEGTSTISLANTGETGAIENTTDREYLTNYKNEYECSYSVSAIEVVTAKITQQYMLLGDYSDLQSMIYDMKIIIGKDFGAPIANKSITITAEYIWSNVSPYASISPPVEVVEYVYSDASTGNEEDILLIVRNTPPYYYKNDGDSQYNNKNGVRNFSPISVYDNSYFVSGAPMFETDSNFAGEKSPDGVRVTVTIDLSYQGIGAVPQSGTIDISTEIYALGGQNSKIETDIESNVFSQITGRDVKTVNETQVHLLSLQNWSLMGKTQPAEGWGLNVCPDPDITSNNINSAPTRAQISKKIELTTKKQIEQITWESWQPIFRDGGTTQYIGSILDKLGSDGAPNSFVNKIDGVEKLSVKAFDSFNTFNTFNLQYDYDISTNTYNKSITINNVSQPAYDASYVTGVTNAAEAQLLWENARVLYLLNNTERKVPESRSKMRYTYLESDAVPHLFSSMKFYGVEDGEYRETLYCRFEHPMSDYWDIADNSHIEYKIQNTTNGEYYSGVVTGKQYKVKGDVKSCIITSVIREKASGNTIIETPGTANTITEDETNIDTITEGEE